MSNERIAKMNPDAVDEAKVFTGRVHFFDGENVEMQGVSFVEIGKWTTAGNERHPEDYDCSYYAALILGYELQMEWLPTGDNQGGIWKYLIFKSKDEKDRPVPFTEEEANTVAAKINSVLQQARQVKTTTTQK